MKKILIIMFLLSFLVKTHSQTRVNTLVGITDNGIGYQLNSNTTINSDKGIELEFGIFFNNNEIELNSIEIPFQVGTAQFGVSKRILKTNSDLFSISANGGLSLGAELVNNGSKDLPSGALITGESKIIFGGYLGIDSKLKLSPKFDLVGRYNFFLHDSSISPQKFIAGLGIGYNF